MALPWKMQDSSTPVKFQPGMKAVAGYIGGDTPHVWTPLEWERYKGIPKLPIFVRSTPGTVAEGRDDGWIAVQQLFALGVPKGKAVAYDKETDISPAQVLGFRLVVEWAGYRVWVYGSRDFVFRNPSRNYWPADYTNVPHWPTRNSRACQYSGNVSTPDGAIDISCIRWWQIRSGKLWT